MRIVIREKADADLDGIYSWIEKYTPGAAGGADRRVVGGVVGAAGRESCAGGAKTCKQSSRP